MDKNFSQFEVWLLETHPYLQLLDWQRKYALAYLSRDIRTLVEIQPLGSAMGRTLLGQLLYEFQEEVLYGG